MLSIIVAMGKNHEIGKENKLIWHLPADLKRFQEITSGKTIIMGRKTFESLGRVLPNRKHIVLTKNQDFSYEDPMVEIITDKKEIEPYIVSREEVFVIGGASIYQMLMPYVQKMYITQIEETFEADTFFPEIKEAEWKMIAREKGIKNEKNPYDYEFRTYIKK